MLLQVKDLQPLDFIISYKEPTNFFEKIGNAGIIAKGKQVYPGGIWKANHGRIVEEEKIAGLLVCQGFEWTHPKSQSFPVQEWMLTPGYSWVLRLKNLPEITKLEMGWEIGQHINKRYDYLQLFGIYFGWKWLHFGESREVCSTGAREIFENLTGINLFTEVERWQTLPCSWLNSMYKFDWLNEPEGADINPLLKRILERRSSLVTDEMALLYVNP